MTQMIIAIIAGTAIGSMIADVARDLYSYQRMKWKFAKWEEDLNKDLDCDGDCANCDCEED